MDVRTLPGEGLWLFNGPVGGLHSHEHYLVAGRFLNDSSSFVLHSHFNGFEWRDGTQVEFRRDKNAVFIKITTPDFPPQSAEFPNGLSSPQGDFRFRIEVHNGTPAGTRVLIWRDWQSFQGDVINNRTPVSLGNVDFDSKKNGWFFNSFGRGVRWGLELFQVNMMKVGREAAYVR